MMTKSKKMDELIFWGEDRYMLHESQTPNKRGNQHIASEATHALKGMEAVFAYAGGNLADPNTEDTPLRYLAALMEMTSGYGEDPTAHLDKVFSQEPDESYDELILSAGIPFVSLCEHHMLPFYGEISIAYIPQEEGNIVGLSKLARLAEGYAKRFQVQERLTTQIRNALDDKLEPLGAAVIVKGTHTCQCMRGVKKDGVMITSSLSGVFRDDNNNARAELYSALDLAKKL